MNSKAISEIKEISRDLLYIHHRIAGISQLLITAGHGNEETGMIGIGHCLDDIAQKLLPDDGDEDGISARLGEVGRMLQGDSRTRKQGEGIEPEGARAQRVNEKRSDPQANTLLDCINKLDVLLLTGWQMQKGKGVRH